MSKEVAIKQKLEIQSWGDLMERAEFLAKSSLIPSTLRGKPADVAVILQAGVEMGVPPLQALNGIDVIQGRPTVSPELGLAMVRSRFPDAWVVFEKLSESEAVVSMARSIDRKDEKYTATWNLDKARKMKLLSKDNYQNQPGNMLKWRAVGECLKVIFPDVLSGLEVSTDYLDVDGNEVSYDVPEKGSKAKKLDAIISGKAEVVVEATRVDSVRPEPVVTFDDFSEPDFVAEPEIEMPTPVVRQPNPLDNYELKVGKYKGQRLGSIGRNDLGAMVTAVNAHFQEAKQEPTPLWKAALKVVSEYLQFERDQDGKTEIHG